jgi:RNA polymerase sigma-70 factor (ECF subfamily)
MAEDTKTEDPQLELVEGDLTAAAIAEDRLKVAPAVREIVDEDHDLVEAARAGDRAAFSRLFERHHGRVYAMCSRLLRDRVEVEDAVQTAFLEAWRSLHRFEGRSRFSTWITRIAIHTCLGFRRRLKRLLLPTEDTLEPGPDQLMWGSAPVAPDDGAAHRDRRRAVADILDHLSAKKRVVFVLSELEGMTAPEISAILEIPDATVRTRLFHARKEIARLVRDHPGFADLFAERGER